MRIGILTGGGDCPGLNTVIRGLVLAGTKQYGYEFVGFLDGWKGLVENLQRPLSVDDVRSQYDVGGTLLGTSRTNPLKDPAQAEQLRANLAANNIDVLVAIGGDDTLGVAAQLAQDGVSIVGIPKTIDNDLSATDATFGFDTAITIATEAVDRLHTTARSHHRVLVAEVMGRHAGWIALYAGIAGGADFTMLPERETSLEELCAAVQREYGPDRKNYAVVVVSEGAALTQQKDRTTQDDSRDAFGNVRLGGIGSEVAAAIQRETGIETRDVVLGHLQRGGAPSPADRVLSTRYGIYAAEMIQAEKFGQMAALQGQRIVAVPLTEATAATKTVGPEWLAALDILNA